MKHVQANTKNKSFIDMSYKLREAGVKNSDFCLRITDLDLLNVDPHSDKLTYREKEKIVFECKSNIWYFLREVARVRDHRDNRAITSVTMNPATLAKVYCSRGDIDSYTVSPRQTFKTTHSLLILLYDAIFTNTESTRKHILTNINDLSSLLEMYSMLPAYIRDQCKDLKKYIIYQNAKTNYCNIGSMLITDIEHIEYDEKDYASLNEYMDELRDERNTLGVPVYTHVIFDSTVGDNTSIYELTKRWDVSYFDASPHVIKTKLFKDTPNLIFYIECDYEAMGFDKSWEEKITRYLTHGIDLERNQNLINREIKLIRPVKLTREDLSKPTPTIVEVEKEYSSVIKVEKESSSNLIKVETSTDERLLLVAESINSKLGMILDLLNK